MDHSQYTIFIDGKWSLEDLYIFPRAYEQVYFALEALSPTNEDEADERIMRAFNAFPWRGGYSAVAFYNQLKWATPKRYRPEVRSIRYASPGYIDLLLNLPEAIKVAAVITAIAGSLTAANKTYHDIHSGLQKRELLRIEIERKKLKLKREELQFVLKSSESILKRLGLSSMEQLNERTKDPLVSLKILLSVYRRIRTLAEYVEAGKADFSEANATTKRFRIDE